MSIPATTLFTLPPVKQSRDVALDMARVAIFFDLAIAAYLSV
jgi:hypothetical protein